MAARILDGKALAQSLRASAARAAGALAARGVHPALAIVVAGEDPASRVYVRNKLRACDEAGIRATVHEFPARVAPAALLERIAALNADASTHGLLVQLPLPAGIDAAPLLAAVAPEKDVDGLHAQNLGALVSGRPGFVPCTPAGIMRLLEHEGIALAGRRAVVIGRSNIVGKPMAMLLLQKDATVTICHSRTADLAAMTREADVLVAALGRARRVTADMVRPGACVIDVGIHRLPDGKLAGDVDFEAVRERAGAITPVPGGVGPMTIAMLLENTLRAAGRA